MTNRTPLDIVIAYQDAWTSHDFETAAGLLAGDVVFEGPNGLGYQGPEAMMAAVSRFALQCEPGWHRVAAAGDADGALVMYDCQLRSGERIRCADHFAVRDGRIVKETLLFDTAAFQAAVAKAAARS